MCLQVSRPALPVRAAAIPFKVRPEQTSSNQQIHNRIRTAEWLGLDAAIARRNSICISNDLRPECRDGKEGDFETGPFYVDFDRHTKRCFVTMNKPVGHTVIGGGPFQTRAKARAAIKMISGC